MSLLNPLAMLAPPAFIDWFHTPAREVFGGVLLLVALAVLFVVIEAIPDMIRYIRMNKM